MIEIPRVGRLTLQRKGVRSVKFYHVMVREGCVASSLC